jgi:hypothetical protein
MKLFLAAILLSPVMGLAQSANQFTITGHVQGLPENSRVCVTDVSNPTDTVAQSTVKGGQFVLSGHVSEPNLYEVNFLAIGKKAPLFMGNDKIDLTGTIDDLKDLKATGSPSNDDFVAFQAQFNPYFSRLNVLMGMANAAA